MSHATDLLELGLNLVILTTNEINPGVFQMRYQSMYKPSVLTFTWDVNRDVRFELTVSHICPISDQYNAIWG